MKDVMIDVIKLNCQSSYKYLPSLHHKVLVELWFHVTVAYKLRPIWRFLTQCSNLISTIMNATSHDHTTVIEDSKIVEKNRLPFFNITLSGQNQIRLLQDILHNLEEKEAFGRWPISPPDVVSDCAAPAAPIPLWSSYLLWIGAVSLRLKNGGLKSSTYSDCCV